MIVLCGKSGSGKNSTQDTLVNRGMERIITYTTRPMRPGEIDGVTYHFISEEEFLQKRESGFFLESTSYFPASGGEWFYGTNADDFRLNGVLILNPSGVKALTPELREKYEIIVIYLNCPEDMLRKRLINRGDDPSEVDRRLKADQVDFAELGVCGEDVHRIDICFPVRPWHTIDHIAQKALREHNERENILWFRRMTNSENI